MSPTSLLQWTCGAVMLAALSWPSGSVLAQGVEPRATVLLTNRYLWRGIRRAAGWNLQPEVSLGLRGGSNRVAVGAWSNVELSTHRDRSLTDLRPGDWGFSEFDFWVEASHEFTAGNVAAGFVWYQYRGWTGDVGTGELYARFRGSGRNRLKLSPEVSLWYDPVKRNSGYFETAVTAPVLALPFIEPTLLAYTTLAAGFAMGRPDDRPELSPSSFEISGFTHADASTGIRVRQGMLGGTFLLNFAGHLMYAHDGATRRKSLRPGDESGRLRPFLTLEWGLSWPAYPQE